MDGECCCSVRSDVYWRKCNIAHVSALTPMNVPGINKRLYTETEQFLSDTIRDLAETMTAAGEKECKLAIEKGDYHQGVPAITVVVDGGWSKRSHKHTYNAKSGVAVIFGQLTKKLA